MFKCITSKGMPYYALLDSECNALLRGEFNLVRNTHGQYCDKNKVDLLIYDNNDNLVATINRME